ncbi:MAG: SAM-dependent methyltransferase [Gammaproteobacteria bacterium]|nr:SAM-dependent methyltransferase [Gammaproteobacteria bacterium]
MNNDNLADLYLIGTGILGMRQISAEAYDALSRCRKVFHLTSNQEGLKMICPDVVDNAGEYWTGERPGIVYKRIADKVVAEVKNGPGVANVIYGHPLFFDDINIELIRQARELDLNYVVLPGISCLDTLSTDLEIDYGDGLQVYEAQDLVFNEHPLNPRVHAVILQIGLFGTQNLTIPNAPCPEGRFSLLQQYLEKYYSPDHLVTIAFSDRGDEWTRFQLQCRVSEIDANRKNIFKGTTMYIPPVR